MKILVFSAHPDDAETGAGGFCLKASRAGHDVLVIHISKEVQGRTYDGVPESAVRVEEARQAAKVLGVKVTFLDYLMAECPVTTESSRVVAELIEREDPRLVLTQWPVDTHPDHQVVGVLPLRHYIYDRPYDLGFYEVYTGIQTLSFTPNRWLDIADVIELKEKAIMCHVSQNPQAQVDRHRKMSTWRGMEMRLEQCEAFHMLGSTNVFDEIFPTRAAFAPSGGFHPIRGRQP
ncbi:MAG: PIG-L deacetylase family protein [Planctomycetota bacterium]